MRWGIKIINLNWSLDLSLALQLNTSLLKIIQWKIIWKIFFMSEPWLTDCHCEASVCNYQTLTEGFIKKKKKLSFAFYKVVYVFKQGKGIHTTIAASELACVGMFIIHLHHCLRVISLFSYRNWKLHESKTHCIIIARVWYSYQIMYSHGLSCVIQLFVLAVCAHSQDAFTYYNPASKIHTFILSLRYNL